MAHSFITLQNTYNKKQLEQCGERAQSGTVKKQILTARVQDSSNILNGISRTSCVNDNAGFAVAPAQSSADAAASPVLQQCRLPRPCRTRELRGSGTALGRLRRRGNGGRASAGKPFCAHCPGRCRRGSRVAASLPSRREPPTSRRTRSVAGTGLVAVPRPRHVLTAMRPPSLASAGLSRAAPGLSAGPPRPRRCFLRLYDTLRTKRLVQEVSRAHDGARARPAPLRSRTGSVAALFSALPARSAHAPAVP